MDEEATTTGEAWMIAIRPHTLPAGIAPVIVGTGVAVAEGMFSLWPALAALIGALLIQIGTNLANDYYDAQRGVDTEERTGFTRVTQAGLLPPERVKRAMALTFLAAIALGTYLVYVGGLPIVIIGLASVAAGIAYAGGPFPFGSYGLGDLFVFVFFGLVAVVGTYYVQAADLLADPFPLWIPAGSISTAAVVASLSMAGLTTAILVVNNLRDIETDGAAGKRTLAVLIGPTWSKVEFVGLVGLAYLVPVWLFWAAWGPAVLLPAVTLPYAIVLVDRVVRGPGGEALNRTLSGVGRLLTAYAVLFAVGVVVA